jgi:phosphoglycolate phosphatase
VYKVINLEVNGAQLDNIELIIFDKDGTLFELYSYFSTLAMARGKNLCRRLDIVENSLPEWIALQMGVDIQNQRMSPGGPLGVYNREYIQNLLHDQLKAKGYSVERDAIQSAFEDTDRYMCHEDVLKRSHVPVRGSHDFLKSIDGRCKGALFSYDLTDRLELITRMFEVRGNFDMFLGGDRIIHSKPDPWGAVKIMSDLQVSPQNTALIGDSIFDIECGRRANCSYLITMLSEISNPALSKQMSCAVLNDFTEIRVC